MLGSKPPLAAWLSPLSSFSPFFSPPWLSHVEPHCVCIKFYSEFVSSKAGLPLIHLGSLSLGIQRDNRSHGASPHS